MQDTILTLSGAGLPPWSARGLRQSLQPLDGGGLRRTVNGTLVDLGLPQHRKYRSSISAADVAPPAFGGLWRGMALTVGCAAELGHRLVLVAGAGGTTIERDAVAGAGRAVAASGRLAAATIVGRTASVDFGDPGLGGDAWLYYRPVLSMLVTGWTGDFDEWQAGRDWSLELEEV